MLAYFLAVSVVFLLAAIYRYRLPPEPFFDADGWTYLWGGMKKLTGGYYEHAFGREYLYPVMIEVELFVFGSFGAVTCIQHALGLVSGSLLLGCCHRLGSIARASRPEAQQTGWCSPCWPGLALTAVYLFNFKTSFYEHSLRPEAVFPCFALASVLLNLMIIDGLHPARPPARHLLYLAGVNLAVCVVVLLLRPTFRLSALAANVPFALLLLRRDYSLARRATVFGLSLLVAGAIWLPEALYSANDRWSIRFLGERLFSAHCDLISRQLDADLAAHHPGPYDESWLRSVAASVAAKLAESRRPENLPWESLGFNADYIVLSGSPLAPYFPDNVAGDRDMAAFCRHYFLRSALHQPVAMAHRILAQLGIFYQTGARAGWIPRLLWKRHRSKKRYEAPPPEENLGTLYTLSVQKLHPGAPFDGLIASSAAARAYFRTCQQLAPSPAPLVKFSAATLADHLFWLAHVALALLALCLCVAFPRFIFGGTSLQTLAWTSWLIFAYPFGSCLATVIAFVVQNRYVEAVDSLVLVSAYAFGVFLWRAFWSRRGGRGVEGVEGVRS